MFFLKVPCVIFLFIVAFMIPVFASEYIKPDERQKVIDSLVAKYGTQERPRMNVCIAQTALYWGREDGTVEEFSQFCMDNFIADRVELKKFLSFLEKGLEEYDFDYVHRMMERASYSKPFYYKIFSSYRPEFHFSDDVFSSKAGFTVLLNFPIVSLDEMSRKNFFWMKEFTREDWIAFRLASKFSHRIPAKILQESLSSNYAKDDFLNAFTEQKRLDSFARINKTFLARTFNDVLEVPEAKYETMLKNVLSDKSVKKVYNLYKNEVNDEFGIDKIKLTRVTSEKYENISDLSRDLNVILLRLGFSKSAVDFLTDNIIIQNSETTGIDFYKTAGSEKAFLFVNFTEKLPYEEYQSVIGGLGEGISHIYSTYNMDSYFLKGFPNDAFPLAFSKIFEMKASESLGIADYNKVSRNYFVLNAFWDTWTESFASLHAIYLWRWMYANSEMTSYELKQADEAIWKGLYSAYFLPITNDNELWAEIREKKYTSSQDFNKPLVGILACQLSEYMKDKNIAQETERMCATGRVTPDVWMQKAVGADISSEAISVQVSEMF